MNKITAAIYAEYGYLMWQACYNRFYMITDNLFFEFL